MNRDELWYEAVEFCEYVDAHFPTIHSVWVFGSYLWKYNPGDMDVYVDYEGPQKLSGSGFPHMHPTNSADQTKNRVLIWTRACGMLERDFSDREGFMLKEILMLREQIEGLRLAARGPPRRFGYMGVKE